MLKVCNFLHKKETSNYTDMYIFKLNQEIILLVCVVLGLVAGAPQIAGGFGQGAAGGFDAQNSQGGGIDLSGQGQFSDGSFGPFGGQVQSGEFSGSLQASGFDNQNVGGFGAGQAQGQFGGW